MWRPAKAGDDRIPLHLVLICGITALIVACIVYPFLPGQYDSLAMPLSTMAQAFGAVGTLLICPIGLLWLVAEARGQARRKRGLPAGTARSMFARASMIASSVVALVVILVAYATVGISLALPVFAVWVYAVRRLIPRVRRLRSASAEHFSPVPLYLSLVPGMVLLCQLALAAPVTEFSRNRAIANAASLVDPIEQYHARHGNYPSSLSAVWKDYYPSIVGVEKYHYVPNAEAYNLYFEQPRFLLDNIGTREFVVYNKLDEQFMLSHCAWILRMTPRELQTSQGWYAVHEAATPHWRYFWFD